MSLLFTPTSSQGKDVIDLFFMKTRKTGKWDFSSEETWRNDEEGRLNLPLESDMLSKYEVLLIFLGITSLESP